MADQLTEYLEGDALYHQLLVQTVRGTEQPVMTLGALLENVKMLRWNGASLDAGQRAQLAAVEDRLSDAGRVWRQQWQSLLRREYKALLDTWQWYLDDAAHEERAREDYASEAQTRTRLALVAQELEGDPASEGLRARLANLDQRLRGMLRGASYVGPRGEESHYPPAQNWWLYGAPAGNR